ncbi:MAG TPA: ATP-binding protein [Tepidisphaeraceae bacterium]|nr:ATP-binding protein [Tepidisphaeraceae bacterium]
MANLPTNPAAAPAAAALELNLTSDPANLASARKAIEDYVLGCGLSRSAADEVGLVVNEALANVYRHAYRGETGQPVVLRADPVGDGVQISIRDWGTGENPAAKLWAAKDPMKPGGLGLVCLRQLTDDVRFEPQSGGGMLLTMVKRKN